MLGFSSSPRISVPLTASTTLSMVFSALDPGSGFTTQGTRDVFGVGDDTAPGRAALDELEQRFDLRPHASFAEVPRRCKRFGLSHGDPAQPLLVGLTEADRHALHPGWNHQQVGLH